MHWAIDLDDLEAKRMRLLLPRLPASVLQAWLARTLPGLEQPSLLRWDLLRTALWLLTCLGRAEEALEVGEMWRALLEGEGLALPLLETEYAMALAAGFLGRRAQAARWMDAALGKAASMGVVGPFVHGPELDGIRREVFVDWAALPGRSDPASIALVARLSSAAGGGPRPSPATGARAIAMLSERETEVLRAIRDGRSNKEIADLLFVAESTVKTHLKNIFVKLKVSNRTRAVSLASDAGMI
jgi:DNA-binding CsgD family transcriptional regulator